MVTKKKKSDEESWDKICDLIGTRFEKDIKEREPKTRCWSWYHESRGGGFGRLVFILGVLLALNALGKLDGVSSWILALIIVGFALMKF